MPALELPEGKTEEVTFATLPYVGTPLDGGTYYRAITVPAHVEAADVEEYAAKGVLNSIQFKAPNADDAARTARHLTGQYVFSVERIEREQVAA